MNRYDPRTPRTVFGVAAVAMTAATLAISVLLPATLDFAASDGVIAQSGDVYRTTAIEHVTSIDVVAIRARPGQIVQSRASLGRALSV